MAYGASANVWLGDLIHVDRGHHARWHARTLKCVLQGEPVHGCCEHADVVGRCAIHAGSGCGGHAAEDVATADDDANLHAERRHCLHLFGNECDDCRINAVLKLPEECLP